MSNSFEKVSPELSREVHGNGGGSGSGLKVVVVGVLLGAAAGCGAVFMIPQLREFRFGKPKYESVARITIARRAPLDKQSSVDPRAFNFVGQDELETHALTLCSGSTAYKAMMESKLDTLPSFREMSKERALQAIVDGVSVSRGDKKHAGASVIDIGFTGPNSKDCREVIRAMIIVFQGELQGTYRKTTEQMREIYAKIRTDTEARLVNLKNHYRKLQKDSSPVSSEQAAPVETSRLALVYQDLDKTESSIRDLEYLQSAVVAKLKEGTPRVVVLNWLLASPGFSKWEDLKGADGKPVAGPSEQDGLDLRLQVLSMVIDSEKHRRDALAAKAQAEESRVKQMQTAQTEFRFLAQEIEDQQKRLDVAVDQIRQIEVSPSDGYVVNTIKEPGYGELVQMPLGQAMAIYGSIGAVLGLLLSLPVALWRTMAA